MGISRHGWAIGLGLAAVWGTALFIGCNAGVSGAGGFGGTGGSASATGTGNASGGAGSTTQGSTVTGFGNGGTGGVPIDVPINPCGTKCGPTELCDGASKGIDDNCNGVVDEGCPCSPGEAESCFKGDPSYLMTPGCHPGTQKCSENGVWGACVGGNHATENCFNADPNSCHPISASPFATVDLKTGTGNYSNDADPGSSDWSITCPPGVNPCPTVDSMGNVQVLVSGEYTVTYTKTVNGVPMMCSYPLYVGAPGLRVELSWDYPTGGTSNAVDLDLHLHQPADTQNFYVTGAAADCNWDDCKADFFDPNSSFGPEWFPAAPQPPGMPVNWDKNPVMNQNSCYFAPRGVGATWQGYNNGCHNPRLDLDNITCDLALSDPQNLSFCAPENANIDIPPKDQWMRIGVHYYSHHSYGGTIHPVVKIYCDGQLSAQLGDKGFYNPETPVTWPASQSDDFWPVADVKFSGDMCAKGCTVKPIYQNNDQNTRQPIYQTGFGLGSGFFGPPYPP